MQVLKLTNSGMPVAWTSLENAAALICKGIVNWELGHAVQLRGGHNHFGQRSVIDIPAIIAVDGARQSRRTTPLLTNRALFKRDHCRCLYCGEVFSHRELTRDHVFPRSRGGLDTWNNVVTSCSRCNHQKDCRTPEEAGMPLLAIPYTPNPFEIAYLQGRKVLQDQEDYLKQQFGQFRLAA